MAAVYPFQYKQFIQHKNLVEDVDASHVNDLQNEVAAIEQVLGLNPAADSTLKMKVNSWASVGARMSAIQRGQGLPVFFAYKSADTVKTLSNQASKQVAFPRPSTTNDPENLYNGTGFTTNRSGWWFLQAQAMWTNGTGANGAGWDRSIGFSVNGNSVSSQDLTPIGDGNTRMSTVWFGPISAGAKVTLWLYHPLTNRTLPVNNMQLSAGMLREI